MAILMITLFSHTRSFAPTEGPDSFGMDS